ncbi:MAG: hypothetical protein JRI96_16990, partial [Deltaproteobacteria bacterium]|nr:hypothetical protein [Deltaproteobacteria bacterium]
GRSTGVMETVSGGLTAGRQRSLTERNKPLEKIEIVAKNGVYYEVGEGADRRAFADRDQASQYGDEVKDNYFSSLTGGTGVSAFMGHITWEYEGQYYEVGHGSDKKIFTRRQQAEQYAQTLMEQQEVVHAPEVATGGMIQAPGLETASASGHTSGHVLNTAAGAAVAAGRPTSSVDIARFLADNWLDYDEAGNFVDENYAYSLVMERSPAGPAPHLNAPVSKAVGMDAGGKGSFTFVAKDPVHNPYGLITSDGSGSIIAVERDIDIFTPHGAATQQGEKVFGATKTHLDVLSQVLDPNTGSKEGSYWQWKDYDGSLAEGKYRQAFIKANHFDEQTAMSYLKDYLDKKDLNASAKARLGESTSGLAGSLGNLLTGRGSLSEVGSSILDTAGAGAGYIKGAADKQLFFDSVITTNKGGMEFGEALTNEATGEVFAGITRGEIYDLQGRTVIYQEPRVNRNKGTIEFEEKARRRIPVLEAAGTFGVAESVRRGLAVSGNAVEIGGVQRQFTVHRDNNALAILKKEKPGDEDQYLALTRNKNGQITGASLIREITSFEAGENRTLLGRRGEAHSIEFAATTAFQRINGEIQKNEAGQPITVQEKYNLRITEAEGITSFMLNSYADKDGNFAGYRVDPFTMALSEGAQWWGIRELDPDSIDRDQTIAYSSQILNNGHVIRNSLGVWGSAEPMIIGRNDALLRETYLAKPEIRPNKAFEGVDIDFGRSSIDEIKSVLKGRLGNLSQPLRDRLATAIDGVKTPKPGDEKTAEIIAKSKEDLRDILNTSVDYHVDRFAHFFARDDNGEWSVPAKVGFNEELGRQFSLGWQLNKEPVASSMLKTQHGIEAREEIEIVNNHAEYNKKKYYLEIDKVRDGKDLLTLKPLDGEGDSIAVEKIVTRDSSRFAKIRDSSVLPALGYGASPDGILKSAPFIASGVRNPTITGRFQVSEPARQQPLPANYEEYIRNPTRGPISKQYFDKLKAGEFKDRDGLLSPLGAFTIPELAQVPAPGLSTESSHETEGYEIEVGGVSYELFNINKEETTAMLSSADGTRTMAISIDRNEDGVLSATVPLNTNTEEGTTEQGTPFFQPTRRSLVLKTFALDPKNIFENPVNKVVGAAIFP